MVNMCYFLCISCPEFVLTLSNFELLNCSFVFTVYKEGICTGIFIPGFRSTRTYSTLHSLRKFCSRTRPPQIWSNQPFIDCKLGAFTQVYFSIFHLKQATQPVFSLLVFLLCFSCVIRIKHFPYFGAMFLSSIFFGRN